MLKKMAATTAFAGVLALTAVPFANAQGTGTEPPKAPSPSGGAMTKSGSMSKSSMSKGGGMMKKKHMKKKM